MSKSERDQFGRLIMPPPPKEDDVVVVRFCTNCGCVHDHPLEFDTFTIICPDCKEGGNVPNAGNPRQRRTFKELREMDMEPRRSEWRERYCPLPRSQDA